MHPCLLPAQPQPQPVSEILWTMMEEFLTDMREFGFHPALCLHRRRGVIVAQDVGFDERAERHN